ncbi:hypothetical protein TRFO_24982 [Tritrichomonas foetus]|uniref:Uncharacterized protein n=1 Tax=Tritrichomonas foetus TaxID=1144522 RepID=A0A1J4K5Z9_9EUKA|nr:hypothetical protein TRFO_24982 [Tritrichomonas foetus]|eukprot:OHT06881.1 hypothetical protein TRFO_24982 [Tritrichomonas foetus]
MRAFATLGLKSGRVSWPAQFTANKLFSLKITRASSPSSLLVNFAILLCEGGNKKRILENASTIILYINPNIGDTFQTANSYHNMPLEEYLVDMIQTQLTSKMLNTTADSFNNRKYFFLICPKFITPPFDPLFMSQLLQFTSEFVRDIVLSLKQENKIVETQQIRVFLRAILNDDDPNIF